MRKMLRFIALLLVAVVLLQGGSVRGQTNNYDDYIWQTFLTYSISGAGDLQTRLDEEVQKVVSAGHLAPFRFFFDGWRGDSYYWSNPGDVVSVLSYAYPYVSPNLQTELRTYLKSEITNYAPWRSEYLYADEGVRRERASVPPVPHSRLGWYCQDYPWLQNLYGVWLYAHTTGDWETVEGNWAAIESFYTSHQGDTEIYAGVCGAIGFARMADKVGETAQRDAAVDLVTNSLGRDVDDFVLAAEERLNNFNYDQGTRYGPGSGVLLFPVTYDLCPEVGRYLHDQELTAVESDFERMAYISPIWYMSKGALLNETVHSEINFNPPVTNWGPFLAEALVLQKPGEELRKHIGSSYAAVGDLYYIAKLVSAIRAHGTTAWSEDGYSEVDTDSDCEIDVGDIQAVADRWQCALGDGCYEAQYDIDDNDVIDISDTMAVASRWGCECGDECYADPS